MQKNILFVRAIKIKTANSQGYKMFLKTGNFNDSKPFVLKSSFINRYIINPHLCICK